MLAGNAIRNRRNHSRNRSSGITPSYSCDKGGGTLRVNGFTIEVKPQMRGGEPVCHASIRSPQGEIVYEGDNNLGPTDIDPVTGKDINGDGYPDAVLVDDSGSA